MLRPDMQILQQICWVADMVDVLPDYTCVYRKSHCAHHEEPPSYASATGSWKTRLSNPKEKFEFLVKWLERYFAANKPNDSESKKDLQDEIQ